MQANTDNWLVSSKNMLNLLEEKLNGDVKEQEAKMLFDSLVKHIDLLNTMLTNQRTHNKEIVERIYGYIK